MQGRKYNFMHAFMKFAVAGCKFGKVFVTINTFNKNFEIFLGKFFLYKIFLCHSTLGPEACGHRCTSIQVRTQKIVERGSLSSGDLH